MAKKKKPDPDMEEGETPEAGGEEVAAGGGKKKLIMIGGLVALLAAGGGGGYYFFLKPKPAEHVEAKAEKKGSSFIDVPEMTVNLSAAASERQQFFKVKIALEVGDAKIAELITPVMPRVLDTFQTYLREMRSSDLDGSAAMYRLKEELMRRVNVAIYPAKVEAVLFKEVLVQ